MKNVIFLFLLVFPLSTFSQQAHDDQHISQLLEVTEQGVLQPQNVAYNEQAHSLIIGEFIIPISEHTKVKRVKQKGNPAVEFLLQEKTTITSTANPDLRKAWFVVGFKSKKSAKSFIKTFRKASPK